MNDMSERLKQPTEKTPRPPEREIVSSMDEIADTIGRFSVDPTELPTRPLVIGDPEEIARILGDVEVVDPSLLELVGGLESDNEIFYSAVITAGKARSLAQEVTRSADKRILNNFADKILDTTSKALAGVGGKKALTVSLLPVLAVACSKTDVSPTIDIQPTPESVATEQIKVEEPTPIPPEPTPFPTVPPESFSNNKQALIREGYRVVEEDVGWKIVDKDRENMVATAVSEEKIAINVNGETKEFSQEAFVPMVLNGDTVYLLTIQENGQNVDYFYIKETGEWVTPIEVQTNPDNPENYTQIELEDVWSGRLLYSEMLVAEDFPEGTIVPQYFHFTSDIPSQGFNIEMSIYPGYQPYYEGIGPENEPLRWVGFYQAITEEGKKLIIGTQQQLSSDGRSSIFYHFGFGDHWLTKRTNSDNLMMTELVFMSDKYIVSPLIYSEDGCEKLKYQGRSAQPTACSLYNIENNKPEKSIKSLIASIKSGKLENEIWQADDAGNEVREFQNMVLVPLFQTHSPQFFK